jgi:hypothetical protein
MNDLNECARCTAFLDVYDKEYSKKYCLYCLLEMRDLKKQNKFLM